MRMVLPTPPPDFEDYLMEAFMDEIQGQVLYEDMPDEFKAWLGGLQADDFIAHANEWAQTLDRQGEAA